MLKKMSDIETREQRLVSLSPADGAALDGLLETRSGGLQAVAAPADQTERLQRVENVLGLLDCHPVDPPPADLVDQTLARINESRQQHRFAQQIAQLSVPTGGFGWYEMGALAASLVIMVSLALPMLSRNREDARRIRGASNLANAGVAFSSYAADHDGLLPRRPMLEGAPWYMVGDGLGPDGTARSNSQHSFLLIEKRYIDPRVLRCPGNPHAQTHFEAGATDWNSHAHTSFSSPVTRVVVRIEHSPSQILLVDKNPMFDIRRGEPLRFHSGVTVDTSTLMHGGRGQNMLFSNGSVLWTTKPELEGDKLWMIRGASNLKGHELPEPDDVFIGP
jgi:hypothetical protein